MITHLFRNRWHRTYFELMDAFSANGCSLCVLLSGSESELISNFVIAAEEKKPNSAWSALCTVHKLRLKKIASDAPEVLKILKLALREALSALAHPRKHSSKDRRWFQPFRTGCPLCRELSLRERTLCRSLTRFLGDTEFWKGFSRAPLLCSDHLEKCLCLTQQSMEFKRLVNDQSAKLDQLLNELVRFEATGTQGEYKTAALNWYVDSSWSPLDGSEDAPLTEPDIVLDRTSQSAVELDPSPSPESEELLFENEKLHRQIRDLVERLNELESRAASLHYQVAKLSDDNKRLEMGYTGANIQADGLKQLVRELRQEIEHLKIGSSEANKTTTTGGRG